MMIRQLASGETASYQALRLRALLESPTAFSSSFAEERDRSPAEIAKRIAPAPDGSRRVFGAFVADELSGTIAYARSLPAKTRHSAQLFGMYVAPAHRRQGVARALLTAAIAHARSVEGTRQLKISVNARNDAARVLYQAAGFRRFGLEPRALLVDGCLYDEEHYMLCFDAD